MKIIAIALAALACTSCATAFYPLKMYSGDARANSEVAAIALGTIRYDGETVYAVLIGVDDKLCPDHGRKPGSHENVCGNNTQVLPGTYRFNVVLQTENKITFLGAMYENSWRMTRPFTLEPTRVEAGTVYQVVPIISGDVISAKLVAVCRSTDHQKSIPNIIYKNGACV